MRTENDVFTARDNTKLRSMIWIPEQEPACILQIAHGMTEHIGRYEDMAAELTKEGILVAGYDLRGHGMCDRGGSCATMGENGWKNSLDDIDSFFEMLTGRYPGVPVVLMGFSLGSFLVRDYLCNYKCRAAAVIIAGSGDQPGCMLSVLKYMINRQIHRYGFDSATPLVRKLSFEMYNNKFKPVRTKCDWLCSDTVQIDQYLKDDLCKEEISAGLFYGLLDAMQRTGKITEFQKWKKETPVLLISGKCDSVGDFGKGTQRLEDKMRKAGLEKIEVKLLPHSRHDFLHEYQNGEGKEAVETILNFIKEIK